MNRNKNINFYKLLFNASKYLACLVLFFLPLSSIAQENFNFYISNKGSDSFPGTSYMFPKRTIAGTGVSLKNFSNNKPIVKLGLKAGDIFEETLVTSYPIAINTYTDTATKNDFAILNGSAEFSAGWLKDSGSVNTFHQPIFYNGFVGYGIGGIGKYSFIYVFEIDKALEKTAPFTARKLLQFVSSIKTVENTPGSFYTPVSNQKPLPLHIHTSDGESPNGNKKYRYEVTVRDWGINSTYQPNNHFENLWVRGFGAGNGMLPGGANSYYNKIIFGPGAGIHHLVARSGTINHSLFLPAARNTNSFSVVFYDVEGLARHCYIKNSMFLDISSPIYMHTSFGSNYGAIEIDSVVAFADSLLVGPFMYTANNDSVLLKNVYAEGYFSGYHYGNAKYAAISNSIFKDVVTGIAYNNSKNSINSKVENVFIKTKGTALTSGIIIGDRTTIELHNSIVHVLNNNNSLGNSVTGEFIAGTGNIKNEITAYGNIFICDIDSSKSLRAATTNTNEGIATSKDNWDNNIYILLRGKNIQWSASNSATNNGSYTITNFEDWKKQSGQDKHSLFFDFRNDTRGLKAIFEDAAHGNYNLANTIEGRQVAALQAGMTNPLSCFFKQPSYEEAAELVKRNQSFFLNKCRNPCSQQRIKVDATFSVDSINNRQVQLKWVISEQDNIASFVVQRATANSNFKWIKALRAGYDSVHTLIDNVQPAIEYRYRLMIIAVSGSTCFSDSKKIKLNTNKPFTIYPNPSRGKVFVSMNGYIGRTSFIVTNSNGVIVLVKESLSTYTPKLLDLSNQPPGVYWLKVASAESVSLQSFVLL